RVQQLDHLVIAANLERQLRGRDIGQQNRKNPLAEQLGGLHLGATPGRIEPRPGDEGEDRFAFMRGGLERLLPALAGSKAGNGMQIEENILPTVLNEPIVQGRGGLVVAARMAYEEARHGRDGPDRSLHRSRGPPYSSGPGCFL